MKDHTATVSHRSRLMALDVGTRKIGVAITDPLRLFARPLTTLRRSELNRDRDQLLDLIREYGVGKVVLDVTIGRRQVDQLLARGVSMKIEGWSGPEALREIWSDVPPPKVPKRQPPHKRYSSDDRLPRDDQGD